MRAIPKLGSVRKRLCMALSKLSMSGESELMPEPSEGKSVCPLLFRKSVKRNNEQSNIAHTKQIASFNFFIDVSRPVAFDAGTGRKVSFPQFFDSLPKLRHQTSCFHQRTAREFR